VDEQSDSLPFIVFYNDIKNGRVEAVGRKIMPN
jgi:hypothetical protein